MRIFYLLRKELIEIFRQKEMLFIIFIAPVLQTIILGYVVTTDIRNIPVQIVNLSNRSAAQRLSKRLPEDPRTMSKYSSGER
jgi:ABC-2 type transport system permease protein